MARRYVRDNRGRFASVGATARGGRLRTASGNKRATVTGKIEGAVPTGTIRPNRRSAQSQAATPVARLTPRQKAKRLGARPERMNQGPKVLASNPQGTIGASAPVRNMNRASRKIKGVAPSHSAQMVALDVTTNRGMSTSISGTQLRRQVFKDPGKRVSRVTARAVWRDPSGSGSATKAARQELLVARRAQKPRLAAKNAARQRGDTAAKPAKLSREARLERASATADRISQSRWKASDAATAKLMERRRISSRASRKARSAAFAKEDVAQAKSAKALRSAQRADERAARLKTILNAARRK